MKALHLRVILSGFALILFSLQNYSNASDDFNKLTGLIFQKDLQGVKDLLASGVDVNIRQEQSGATPLTVACSMQGTEEIVKFLISKGAEINLKNKDGDTALGVLIKKQKAATKQKPEKKQKRDEVIKLLKSKGAK